jgi:cytochrome c553
MKQLPGFAFALAAGAQFAIGEDVGFREQVWPLLEARCVKCHGTEKQKGDLRLDSREAALKGGENGPALVPGKPEESLLIKLVHHADKDRTMPPKEKLKDKEITVIEAWIKAGAPWPAATQAAAVAAAGAEKLGDAWSDRRNPIVRIFHGQRLDLWSFKPPC